MSLKDSVSVTISRDDAVKIKGLSNIVSVAAIYSSDAFAVDTDGMLWHWSYDREDSSFVFEPQRVEGILLQNIS